MTSFQVPFLIRGELFDDCGVQHGGRNGGATFFTPSPEQYIDMLPLTRPSQMQDLYKLTLNDIIDFLVELGSRLDINTNAYLKEALDLSIHTSGLSESILRYVYSGFHNYFRRPILENMVENLIGQSSMDTWQEARVMSNNSRVTVRAFGSRGLHIIAGNVPLTGALTVIRNALTRSDALIKTPSNDPLTALAIARTMRDIDVNHPLTRHVTVAYWKGGDESVEEPLYQPKNIEKIIAWGGFDSVKHISKYLQPGIDLITFDPKQSSTIIGKEAFTNDASIAEVAQRLALDVGAMNQEGCVNARVVYVDSGTDEQGLKRLAQLGQLVFDAIQNLPDYLSTPHKAFDRALKEELEGLQFMDDEFTLLGGTQNEGAVIISQSNEPVDFARKLACRVVNLVPIDDINQAINAVNSYTQTIGVYPDTLRQSIKDQLAIQGGQRIVALGCATTGTILSTPQDGLEPIRRMCKWVVDEDAPEGVDWSNPVFI